MRRKTTELNENISILGTGDWHEPRKETVKQAKIRGQSYFITEPMESNVFRKRKMLNVRY